MAKTANETSKNLVQLVDEIDDLISALDDVYGDKETELLMVARFIGAKEFKRVVDFLVNR